MCERTCGGGFSSSDEKMTSDTFGLMLSASTRPIKMSETIKFRRWTGYIKRLGEWWFSLDVKVAMMQRRSGTFAMSKLPGFEIVFSDPDDCFCQNSEKWDAIAVLCAREY